jgi:hypothetical protein
MAMKAKTLFSLIAMTMITLPVFAQGRLSEEELKSTAEKMESDWRFGRSIVRWLEDDGTFARYLETAPMRCPDELEQVLEMVEPSYQEALQVLRLEKQVYRKPGARKWEASLASYFQDTKVAKERIAAAHKTVEMYEKMEKQFPAMIKGMRSRTYKVPQGELVSYSFHLGGGMVRRPSTHGEVQRQKDGTYVASLDTRSFDKFDTFTLTKEQVDTIRKLLIDGEVYKMPRYYDTPVLLLDGPSSSVSVEFTDGSYSCSSTPPDEWGGKNVFAVYNYLRELHPLPEPTEEERQILGY